jgi:hypothetical protein
MKEENRMDEKVEAKLAPAQIGRNGAVIPWAVHMAAYEVYCEVFRPQQALIEDRCRGGFGTVELLAFLYARSFPKSEWRQRTDEVFKQTKLER